MAKEKLLNSKVLAKSRQLYINHGSCISIMAAVYQSRQLYINQTAVQQSQQVYERTFGLRMERGYNPMHVKGNIKCYKHPLNKVKTNQTHVISFHLRNLFER